jgi:transcriptional regulator with XRE-family HTH domain
MGAMTETTFGQTISKARKEKGMSLKELTDKVRREDGEPISPQYLNDIEHDRRSPTSDHLVQQFAEALEIDADWLYYLAGTFPEDIRAKNLTQKDVVNAMQAFRRGGKSKG